MANTTNTAVTIPGAGIPISRVLYFALTVYFLPAIALAFVLIWWSTAQPEPANVGNVFGLLGGFGDDFDRYVRDLLGPLLIPLVTAFAVTITANAQISRDTAKVLLSFTLILLAALTLRVVLSSYSDHIDCLVTAVRGSGADAASCAIPEGRAAIANNVPTAAGPRVSKVFGGILFSYMKEAAGYVALLLGLSIRNFK